jgi:hypothetical protein
MWFASTVAVVKSSLLLLWFWSLVMLLALSSLLLLSLLYSSGRKAFSLLQPFLMLFIPIYVILTYFRALYLFLLFIYCITVYCCRFFCCCREVLSIHLEQFSAWMEIFFIVCLQFTVQFRVYKALNLRAHIVRGLATEGYCNSEYIVYEKPVHCKKGYQFSRPQPGCH